MPQLDFSPIVLCVCFFSTPFIRLIHSYSHILFVCVCMEITRGAHVESVLWLLAHTQWVRNDHKFFLSSAMVVYENRNPQPACSWYHIGVQVMQWKNAGKSTPTHNTQVIYHIVLHRSFKRKHTKQICVQTYRVCVFVCFKVAHDGEAKRVMTCIMVAIYIHFPRFFFAAQRSDWDVVLQSTSHCQC